MGLPFLRFLDVCLEMCGNNVVYGSKLRLSFNGSGYRDGGRDRYLSRSEVKYLERKSKSMMSQDSKVGGGCANGAICRRARP